MILGVTGTIGAGKGTVVEYLKAKGFVQYSISKLLGELVEKEGSPKTREYLSTMATRLQQEYPGGVVEKSYHGKYLTEKPDNVIFESLHRLSEANFLKSVGGFIIAVDAPIEARFRRITKRQEGEKDKVTFEQFKDDARVEDEGGGDEKRDNNIRAVIEHADVVLMNEGTVEELHAQIDAALSGLS